MGQLITEWKHSSLLQLTGALVIMYTLYCFGTAAYIAIFDPAAKLPGPFLRKVSYLPCIVQSLRGKESHAVRDLHAKYGEIVKVSPEMISISAPSAWKEIYGLQGSRKFQKDGYRRLRAGVHDLLTADSTNHARQRAAVHRAFSERALREQEPIFQQHIDLLIHHLEQRCDAAEVVDLLEWLEYLAFDIIGVLALSSSFNCLHSQGFHPWVRLLKAFFKSTHYFLTAQMAGVFFPLILACGPFWHILKGEEHLRRSREKVQERLLTPEAQQRNDFWTYINQKNDDKSGSMSVAEMEVNAALFIAAGSDTTSSTIAGALYLLMRFPETSEKLRAELDAEFTSDDDMSLARLGRLPYLKAVVDEALRMYPALSGDLRRKVPPEGASISGHFVPGGAIVSVYALAASDNAANFANPKRFAPERWLSAGERPDWTREDQLNASKPFSVGPRNCVGMPLAYAECRLTLARLVAHFDMELVDNAFDIGKQKVYIMWDKPPLHVRLRRRVRRSPP